MNWVTSQCDERCFCVFYKCDFLMRGSFGFAFTSSVAILKSGRSSHAGISLDHQKKLKRSLFAQLWSLKVQHQEKCAVDVFRNWQAAGKENHILSTSWWVCSKCTKSWRKVGGPA